MAKAARWFVAVAAAGVAIFALAPHNGMADGVRVVVVFVAAAVAILALAPLEAQRRTRAMQTAARQIGFTFEGEDWSDPSQQPGLGTALFQQGGAGPRNVMTGTAEGLKTSLFDYSYFDPNWRRSRQQTVAAFCQELWLPLFELRPDSFSDPRDPDFGKRIEFDFSERYVLGGPEEDKIRELFNPALTSALISYTPEDHWHIEGMGTTLILYRADITVRADELPAFLQQTSLIASTFFSLCGLKKPVA
jgi:hypothetical protein